MFPNGNAPYSVNIMLEQADATVLGWLWQQACIHANDIWSTVVGFLGSCVRVAIGIAAGEPMPPATIFATVTTGTVLCVTSSKALTAILHLPSDCANAVGFILAIMAMKFVKWLMDQDMASILSFLTRGLLGGEKK